MFDELLPEHLKPEEPSPVRDAVLSAIQAAIDAYADVSLDTVKNSDVLYAKGDFLRLKLEDERGIVQLEGEDDDAYRERGIGYQAVVTPQAICEAINALIAPATCSYLEPMLDSGFLVDTTVRYDAFVGEAPVHPERYYPDDGDPIPYRDPGPCLLFATVPCRTFVIRIPDLAGLDESINLVYSGTRLNPSDPSVPELGGATPPLGSLTLGEHDISTVYGGTGIFPMDYGDANDSKLYLFDGVQGTSNLYSLIVSTVNRLKNYGFSWSLYVD